MHRTRFFSSKMQKFLRILRIYYCSNLPFNAIILFYCYLLSYIHIFNLSPFFTGPALIAVFLKTYAAILYKYA